MASADASRYLVIPENQWSGALKDGRVFHRVPSEVTATLVSSALGRVRATVLDISRSGCRVRTRARCHPGDHYVLRVDATGPRLVTVVWRRDDEVGLAFAEPLCWTIVSAIVFGGSPPA